jgi:hypothetical protein
MGVEKITFGEEEYRMSPPISKKEGRLKGRTRLRPTIIKSSSNSSNAFILHTKCCNLVRLFTFSSLSNYMSMDLYKVISQHTNSYPEMSSYQLSSLEQSKQIIDYGGTVEHLLYVYTVCPLSLLSSWARNCADEKMYYTQ